MPVRAAGDVRCTAAGIAHRGRTARKGRNRRQFSSVGVPWTPAPKSRAIAEKLGAPVSTTLQGLSAFPANHPLHAGFCLGRAAVPAVENAFSELRLPAGRRYAVRRNRDGQLRLESARQPDPRGRESGRVRRELSGESRAGRRCEARTAEAGSRRSVALASDSNARRAAVAAQIAADKRRTGTTWFAHDSQGPREPRAVFRGPAAAARRRRDRRAGRWQPHVPGGGIDAHPSTARTDVADRLQLHGLLRARSRSAPSSRDRTRPSSASSATAHSA